MSQGTGTGAAEAPVWEEPAQTDGTPATSHASPREEGRRRLPKISMPQININPSRMVAPAIVLLITYVAVRYMWPLSFWSWLLVAPLLTLFVYLAGVQKFVDKTTTRPEPTMGWPKRLRKVTRYTGITYVPAMSVDELIAIAGHEHFELMQERSVVVGVFGPHGGVGKSIVATGIAWFGSFFNKTTNLALDAREKRGHFAECFGLWRRDNESRHIPQLNTTPTIRQMLEMHEGGWFERGTQMFDLMGSAEGRMLHVGASDNLRDGKQLTIGVERLISLLKKVRTYYKFIIFECSDVLNTAIDRELMRECDIPIFVHRANSPGSDGETIQGLNVYEAEFGDKIRKHGVLFVLADKDGWTAQEFSREFGGIIPPERVFLVSYDKYFERGKTDKGHDKPEQRDLSRRPSQTRVLADTPKFAVLQWIRGVNAGLRTVPISVRTPRPDLYTAREISRKEPGS